MADKSIRELVNDGAVGPGVPDRLGHESVAAELEDLVRSLEPPVNIALFGSWGSGKTGIGNLLEDRLKADGSVKYIRYDAFKYAETPLRRHFLDAVSKEISTDAAKLVKARYEATTTNRLSLPARDLGLASIIVGAIMALVLVYCGIAAGVHGGPFWHGVGIRFGDALPRLIAPAVVISFLGMLLGKSLTVQVTRPAPTTDDEFEQLFRDVVGKATETRIVIFIDELDRCSADEVVATLDAIRTFLGIKPCIFVIAADQHVLEVALRESARQTTPEDTTNPYYSSGSAVLDKLFAHHLHVPVPLPRRLTTYARDVAADLDGLWKELPDLDRVVSVLVPAHVTSPRRVKRLLNGFATSYRLARRRVDSGLLDADLATRATELAKLVALRTEFPIFAEALAEDDALGDYVVSLYTDPQAPKPALVRDAVWRLACSFAIGSRSPDVLMPEAADSDDDNAEPDPEADTDAESRSEPSPAPPSSARALSQELIEYLQRTSGVDGPRSDLIHLEHAGSAFGLPQDVARQIEAAAVGGRPDDVARLAVALPQDESDDQPSLRALRLLVELTREAPLGIERENLAAALLAVAAKPGERAEPALAQVAQDGFAMAGPPPIRTADDASRVLALASVGRAPSVGSVDEAADRIAVGGDDRASGFLLGVAANREIPCEGRVAAAIATLLCDSATVRGSYGDLDEAGQVVVLGGCESELVRTIKSLASVEETKAAAQGGAGDLIDRSLPEAARAMCVRIVLAADTTEGRNVVESRLADFGPTSDPDTILAYLTAASRRVVQSQSVWLQAVGDAPSMEARVQAACADRLATMGTALVAAITSNEASRSAADGAWDEVAVHLARLTTAIAPDRLPLDTAAAVASIAAADFTDFNVLDQITDSSRALGDAAVIQLHPVADAVVRRLPESVQRLATGVAMPSAADFTRATREALETFADAASDDAVGLVLDAIPEQGSGHLSASDARRWILALRRRLLVGRGEMDHAVVAAWIAADTDALTLAIGATGDPSGVIAYLEAVPVEQRQGVDPAVVREWVGEHPDRAGALVEQAIRAAIEGRLHVDLVSRFVGPSVVPDVIVEGLVAGFEASSITGERINALRAWQAIMPSGEAAATTLTRKVLIPLAQSGSEGVLAAARAVGVASGASKPARDEVRRELRKAAHTDEERNLVEDQLLSQGFAKRRRKPWSLTQVTEDVD